MGPGNYISGGGQDLSGKGASGGSISRPTIKYREYPACGRYFQRYSVGGSSDAASSWLAVLHQPVIITVVELIGWCVAELLHNRERNVPIQLAQFWFHGLVTSNAKI